MLHDILPDSQDSPKWSEEPCHLTGLESAKVASYQGLDTLRVLILLGVRFAPRFFSLARECFFSLLVGQGEQGRPGREVKGNLQHGLVKSSAFHTPADRSLMSILGNCKERISSPGGLSHGSPSSPAVLSPFDQPGTQEDGRLQVAPHTSSPGQPKVLREV